MKCMLIDVSDFIPHSEISYRHKQASIEKKFKESSIKNIYDFSLNDKFKLRYMNAYGDTIL